MNAATTGMNRGQIAEIFVQIAHDTGLLDRKYALGIDCLLLVFTTWLMCRLRTAGSSSNGLDRFSRKDFAKAADDWKNTVMAAYSNHKSALCSQLQTRI